MASKAPRADELPFGDVDQIGKAGPAPLPSAAKSARLDSGGAEPVLSRSAPAPLAARRAPRRFAGLTHAQLGIGVLILGAAIWAMWASAKIFALEDRRVVSVRLASIVNDFVAAEARSGTPPDQLETRTRAFMGALDGVLKSRAADGEVVLVEEAVIASSVPDVTNDVVSDLSRMVRMPVASAMPPAIPQAAVQAVVQSVPGGPAGQSVPVPPAAESSSPFGQAPAPTGLGPGQ